MRLRSGILAAAALAALSLFAQSAEAQCPVGTFSCFFGQDTDGSEANRATNVNSLAAHNAFMSVLSGVSTENFESQSGGPSLVLNYGSTLTATLNSAGGAGIVSSVAAGSTNGYGRYPISGENYWETQSANGGSTFSVSFSDPVGAFGFYGTDIGDLGSQLTLRFSLVGGGTVDWALQYLTTGSLYGNLLYAGFTSNTPFTSVSFLGSYDSDYFGFDDLTIGSRAQVVVPPGGTTVPEPSTDALMVFGLGALAVVRRRRRA